MTVSFELMTTATSVEQLSLAAARWYGQAVALCNQLYHTWAGCTTVLQRLGSNMLLQHYMSARPTFY